MKRILSIILWLCILTIPAHAVLKEKDLARTLGVLKEELRIAYETQQYYKEMHEKQSAAQHQQLISFMQKCEQTALILYSQNSEYTFDMAYACQQATNLYRNLNLNSLPYERMRTWAENEILRYDGLIRALKHLPPIARADRSEVMTSADSTLSHAVDSLSTKVDSLKIDSTEIATSALTPSLVSEEEIITEPYILTHKQQADRAECLKYAEQLKVNIEEFLQSLTNEKEYYDALGDKAKELNDYAQLQYSNMRNSIFRNGGTNYFSILANLPMYIQRAKSTMSSKYGSFENHEGDYSEWRGSHMTFTSFFMIIYIAIAAIVSMLIVRFLIPKRFRTTQFLRKKAMITASLAAILFAIAVMVARNFSDYNFFLMSSSLMILIAWLLFAIFLSFLIRLDGKQVNSAMHVYIPFIVVAYIVIIFRIMLIPNILVNLAFPPVMLICTVWQIMAVHRNKGTLPKADMFYSRICSFAMIAACVMSWLGYTLLAVQIMVWWIFQLAAIQTVTCAYDLIDMFERKVIAMRIRPELKEMKKKGEDIQEQLDEVQKQMTKGRHITRTWLYDFVRLCLVPILAVSSILMSVWWACTIFEMTSLCRDAFVYKFVNQPDLIQLSLAQICLIASLWFVFRYIVYALRGFYRHYHSVMVGDVERANFTLANNVIGIFFWGLFFIIALIVLRIPKSGISVVTAGLATGMGFAMKDLLENFFYGISLMTGRVHVGDYIECDGIQGKVESITYQSTQVLTADGCVIAFLNSALFNKNFKNLTRNHRYELVKLPIGVAYGSNVEDVRAKLIEAITPICQETNEEGECITDISQPVKVAFIDFGASSVDLAVCIWMLVEMKITLSGRVKEIIYNTLNENNIEIPFPQCDVRIRQ